MLAAQCVFAIVKAEHAVVRQTVAQMSRLMHGKQWSQPGESLERLKRLLEFLQQAEGSRFESKDHQLHMALRGKCLEADRLMEVLDGARRQNAELLSEALSLLRQIGLGDSSRVPDLALVLRRHCVDALHHLEIEETVLHGLARQLLTEEEWACLASSMSCVPSLGSNRRASPSLSELDAPSWSSPVAPHASRRTGRDSTPQHCSNPDRPG